MSEKKVYVAEQFIKQQDEKIRNLQATNQQLIEALKYSCDYLNENRLNSIGSGSKAHMEMQKAITNAKQPANHTQQAQSGNTNDCEWYGRASESPVSLDQLIGSPKKK